MKNSKESGARAEVRFEERVEAAGVFAVTTLVGLVAAMGWAMSASGPSDAAEMLHQLDLQLITAAMPR